MNKKNAIIVYLAITTLVVTADLWTKSAVFEMFDATILMTDGERPRLYVGEPDYSVIPGFFDLQCAINHGAYNGWFAGFRWLLLGVSAAWGVGTLGYVLIKRSVDRLMLIGISLTAGGALGNLYDRYFFECVRDFIKWYVVVDGTARIWPNFNIADACILSGVALIMLREILNSRRLRTEAKSEPATSS